MQYNNQRRVEMSESLDSMESLEREAVQIITPYISRARDVLNNSDGPHDAAIKFVSLLLEINTDIGDVLERTMALATELREEQEAAPQSRVCPDCAGTGDIYTDPENPMTCPTCLGSGRETLEVETA